MSRRMSGSTLEALEGAGVLALAWAVDIVSCHLFVVPFFVVKRELLESQPVEGTNPRRPG